MESEMPGTGNAVSPILGLRLETDAMRQEIHHAIDHVLDTVGFCNGPAVGQFEKEFAGYCNVSECVALNSGTSALHVAMQCLNVGPGDEVITVSMSFIATAWPILYLGAKPVFVDIDPERFTLDPGHLAAAITSKTKAIVVVHLYGQCAEMGPILKIAHSLRIPVIEDCCQSHGAEYMGRRAGSMGLINCFSFYPSKNLGACGEGGCITTNDGELAERSRRLKDHGQTQRYVHEEMGYNYRMDGFQAAILSAKLKYLEARTRQRRQVAAAYDRLLAGTAVTTPKPCPDGIHVYHQYVVRCGKRDELRRDLEGRGIATGLHYPIPIHLQPLFRRFGYKEGDLPATEELTRTCVSLPIYPEISETQIQTVADAVKAALG